MNLDEIRDTLMNSIEEQRQADLAANETSQLLGQQKIMYNNDARGTLYSGTPTWESAQLSSQGISKMADINNTYLNKKMNIWQNITKTLDEIETYNKAAEAMAKATKNVSSTTPTTTTQSFLEVYNGLTGGD